MGKSGLGTAFFGTFFFSLNVKHFFFDGLSFHAVMAANMLGYTRADALVVVVVKRCGPFPPLSSSSSSALTLMIVIIIIFFFELSMRVADANIQEESGGGCIHEFLDIHACDRFIRLFFAAVGAPFAYPWIHLAALHRSLFIFY